MFHIRKLWRLTEFLTHWSILSVMVKNKLHRVKFLDEIIFIPTEEKKDVCF